MEQSPLTASGGRVKTLLLAAFTEIDVCFVSFLEFDLLFHCSPERAAGSDPMSCPRNSLFDDTVQKSHVHSTNVFSAYQRE